MLLASATQQLAALTRTHEARAAPSTSSRSIQLVAASRPITGEQTVLPVLAARGSWLEVRLPGRPNGHVGWIERAGTKLSVTPWHIVVTTSLRLVSVYASGHLVRTFRAVVGKQSTPTPLGEFFVEETVSLPPNAVGAPYALALSARSDVLQEFAGGPGQIALHGLLNVGGVLGTAVSHGCVRLANPAIGWLAQRIGPGVPVTITD